MVCASGLLAVEKEDAESVIGEARAGDLEVEGGLTERLIFGYDDLPHLVLSEDFAEHYRVWPRRCFVSPLSQAVYVIKS